MSDNGNRNDGNNVPASPSKTTQPQLQRPQPLSEKDLNTLTSPCKNQPSSKAAKGTAAETATGDAGRLAESAPDWVGKPTWVGAAAGGPRHKQEKNAATYISPSDSIMSPTTQKLSALRGKRWERAGATAGRYV